MSATPKFGQVVERLAGLVRLEGVTGWFAAADLVPCTCGNGSFLVLVRVGKFRRERVVCGRCCYPAKDERELGTVIMNGER